MFTRMITDGAVEFEKAEAGYHGPLYAEISPRTFSILPKRLTSFTNQISSRRQELMTMICNDFRMKSGLFMAV